MPGLPAKQNPGSLLGGGVEPTKHGTKRTSFQRNMKKSDLNRALHLVFATLLRWDCQNCTNGFPRSLPNRLQDPLHIGNGITGFGMGGRQEPKVPAAPGNSQNRALAQKLNPEVVLGFQLS